MAWADTLALLHIHYDSQEAVDLGSEIMKTIQAVSHNESAQLAITKGLCPAFIGRASEQVLTKDRRNATTTCIAPAGTISVLASCSSGIEPHYTLEGSRAMGDGTRLDDGLRGLKTDFIPHTAHEIDWKWHIAHQAAFQQYTDLAVSKTVNMKESATVEDFRQAFLLAWESGCKGITIYRDKCRNTQVIVDKGDESRLIHEAYKTDTKVGMHRRKMTKDADAKRHGFSVGGMEGYLHTGLFPDGTPGELFITGSNQGSTVSGLLASLAIVTSMALQYGVPLESLVNKLQNVRFEPSGATTNPKIPVAPSVVGYIFQYLDHEFLGTKPVEDIKEHSGMLCPECGAEAVYEEGCLHCSKCDWSRCG
jgi:ribonucleoside-diphosphate reductase alpha chain